MLNDIIFYTMRFFLLYLATITTAITSPFVDLSLNALSFDSSASQGSEADVLENDPEGTSVSPPNSGVANVDTSLFSSASSGSVIGIRPLSSDIQASVPETENSHQGDIATSKYLRLFLWIPACETLFPGTKPYCCDEKLNKKKGTANGCGHCMSLPGFLCT